MKHERCIHNMNSKDATCREGVVGDGHTREESDELA